MYASLIPVVIGAQPSFCTQSRFPTALRGAGHCAGDRAGACVAHSCGSSAWPYAEPLSGKPDGLVALQRPRDTADVRTAFLQTVLGLSPCRGWRHPCCIYCVPHWFLWAALHRAPADLLRTQISGHTEQQRWASCRFTIVPIT